MAKITGKLIYIYPTQQLTSKSGNVFTKRDFVIAVQSFDRDTGEPTIDSENTPMLTLTGDRCSQLDSIHKDQIVTVDFYIRGRRYRDENNKEKIITDINVTSVRLAGGIAPAIPASIPSPPSQSASTSVTNPTATSPVNTSVPAVPGKTQEDDLPF